MKASASLSKRNRLALNLQRWIGYGNFLWFGPLFLLLLYGVGRYRCDNLAQIRRRIKEAEAIIGKRPWVICANHLTMIDSMLISAYMHPLSRYAANFARFPWNVPEFVNFGRNVILKVMCYLGQCVFVERAGTLASKKLTWDKVKYLVTQRQPVCIFPEGGRSRTGRVDVDHAVYGIGHIVQDVPECYVLCLYLRGRRQKNFAFFPEKGDRFVMDMRLLQPRSQTPGRRGAREITREIMVALKEMEDQYFSRYGLAGEPNLPEPSTSQEVEA